MRTHVCMPVRVAAVFTTTDDALPPYPLHLPPPSIYMPQGCLTTPDMSACIRVCVCVWLCSTRDSSRWKLVHHGCRIRARVQYNLVRDGSMHLFGEVVAHLRKDDQSSTVDAASEMLRVGEHH